MTLSKQTITNSKPDLRKTRYPNSRNLAPKKIIRKWMKYIVNTSMKKIRCQETPRQLPTISFVSKACFAPNKCAA